MKTNLYFSFYSSERTQPSSLVLELERPPAALPLPPPEPVSRRVRVRPLLLRPVPDRPQPPPPGSGDLRGSRLAAVLVPNRFFGLSNRIPENVGAPLRRVRLLVAVSAVGQRVLLGSCQPTGRRGREGRLASERQCRLSRGTARQQRAARVGRGLFSRLWHCGSCCGGSSLF